VVVATSSLPGDDPVAELAAAEGVTVFRGSEADVLARFEGAASLEPADHIVRLTADCPLIDPEVVRQVVQLHLENDADYTSNSLIRTFPIGLDAEVFRRHALAEAANEASEGPDREHVTPFFYRRPQRYVLANYATPSRLAHLRWTVDTPDDLERLRAMAAAVEDPVGAGWEQFLDTDAARSYGSPAALLPLLPGDLTHDRVEWSPIGLDPGRPPAGWWQRALIEGGPWVNPRGRPFALTYGFDTPQGPARLALEIEDGSAVLWSAGSPAQFERAPGLLAELATRHYGALSLGAERWRAAVSGPGGVAGRSPFP
jgi:spore coat polysaccharide biosynthesis protein SpsF